VRYEPPPGVEVEIDFALTLRKRFSDGRGSLFRRKLLPKLLPMPANLS
jgi:hypothetical protein